MPKQTSFSKSNAQLKKLPTKKKTTADKKALLSYLSAEYGITYFTKTFTYKLEHIHNGTLQNLQMPIPYDVLLDVFKYFKNDLDKQRVYNKKVGKSFSDKQGELNYDLAIVLGKHPDYLQALEEEKIRAIYAVKPQPAVQLVTKATALKNDKDSAVDISKMLEDW